MLVDFEDIPSFITGLSAQYIAVPCHYKILNLFWTLMRYERRRRSGKKNGPENRPWAVRLATGRHLRRRSSVHGTVRF